MEVLLDRNAFRDKMIDLRLAEEEAVAHILESHLGELPLACTFQVGDDAFTVYTLDLVRDTKERFLHSMVTGVLPNETSVTIPASPTHARNRDSKNTVSGEKLVIYIEGIDAPAAKCAFKLLKLQVPTRLQVAELVDLIQTLAYINAWAALESLAHAMNATSLSNASLATALAATARITHNSPMFSKLASEIDTTGRRFMEDEWKNAWESLGHFITIALCQDMKRSSKSAHAKWLWHTLAALLPHSDCIIGEVDVPQNNEGKVAVVQSNVDHGQPFRTLQSAFLEQCKGKQLCQCRSGVVETLTKKSHERFVAHYPRGTHPHSTRRVHLHPVHSLFGQYPEEEMPTF